MSYKLINAKFRNKKTPFERFDLEANQGEITNVFALEKNTHKYIEKAFKGKLEIEDGRFMVNNIDTANHKYVKTKSTLIKKRGFLNIIIPPRISLTLTKLLDLNFLRNARYKKIDKLYNYLSFKKSNNDIDDMKLRREVDSEITDFVSSFLEVEEKLLKEFEYSQNEYNNVKQEIFSENSTTEQYKILINENIRIEQKIFLGELFLTFLQSLYDKIYNLYDLKSSCSCEYNARYSSNKVVKKSAFKFSYIQQKYMVKKNLKFLLVRINEARVIIYKHEKTNKSIKRQLMIEERRIIEKQIFSTLQIDKLKEQLKLWKKIIKDQQEEFSIKQKDFFFNILENKSKQIETKVVFLNHKYHQKVINEGISLGDKNDYKMLLRFYKKEIIPVYKQAKDELNNIIKNLDIKFNPFLIGEFKLTSINSIYLKIVKSINLRKWNIIISADVIHNLTRADFESLIKLFENVKKYYPKITFILLNYAAHDLNNLKADVYSFDNGKIKLLNFSELMIKNHNIVLEKWYKYGFNTLKYHKSEQGIQISGKNWGLESDQFKDSGNIVVNPFFIKAESSGEELFTIDIIIKRQTKFNDTNMKYGINKNGEKIFFYSENIYVINQRVTLYFDANSALDIV